MARRKKSLLGSLEIDGKTLTCSRWESWPPSEVVVYGDAETVRKVKGDEAYERVRVWTAACGLTKMSDGKCPTCPYVLFDGEPVVKPGTNSRAPSIRATRAATLMKKSLER